MKNKTLYYIEYTLIIAVLIAVIYVIPLTESGRCHVWIYDGIAQHYKALVYYRKYLLQIFNTLKQGRLVIPQWDYFIGEGADILSTFNYMLIGSPLALISVFFSEDRLHVCSDLIFYLRFYIAGVGFSVLCFEFGKSKCLPVLLGSITYVFCGWCLCNSVRHPNFLIGYVYLPFFVLLTERTIKGKSGVPMAMACALCSCSNFYWYFNIACMTAVYALVRLFCVHKCDIKTICTKILRLLIPSVIGTLASFIVFLPVITQALTDTRSSNGRGLTLFYEAYYYISILKGFFDITNVREYVFFPYAPCLFAAIILIKDRLDKNKIFGADENTLFCLLMGCILFTIFPVFSYVMSGFEYPSGKWCWALSLLLSYLLVFYYERLTDLSVEDTVVIAVYVLVLIAFRAFVYPSSNHIWELSLLVLAVSLLLKNIHFKRAVMGLCLVGLVVYGLSQCYSTFQANCTCLAKTGGELIPGATGSANYSVHSTIYEDDAHYMKTLAAVAGDNETVRYSGRLLSKNSNMLAGISTTQYYWSLSNKSVIDFRDALGLQAAFNGCSNYENIDDRLRLTSLDSVKYYLVPEGGGGSVPYGYRRIKERVPFSTCVIETSDVFGEYNLYPYYDIYENVNALPFGFSYDNYVIEKEIEALPAADKEVIMTESVVLQEAPELDYYKGSVVRRVIEENISSVSYSDPSFVDDNAIILEEDQKEVLHFDIEGKPNCETYVRLQNTELNDPQKVKRYLPARIDYYDGQSNRKVITIVSSNGIKKQTSVMAKNFVYYHNNEDRSYSLGFSEKPITGIDIIFDKPGIYTIGQISVYYVPIEGYEEDMAKLREASITSSFGVDTITSSGTFRNPQIAVFTESYSPYWKAYVDGKETKTYKANYRNIGVAVPEGTHEIVLKYSNTAYEIGKWVSLLGIVCLIGYSVFERKRING